MSLIESIAQVIAAHRDLAYAAIFLIALLESLPILGLFVPGSTLIVGAAILVPSGTLSLAPLTVAAVLGSFVGDSLSFWLGRQYGRGLLSIGVLARRPELVRQAEQFFQRHGGKGILLGRFTPPVRGIVPAIAGIARIKWRRFLPTAALAAVAWAPVHILPGALIGASLELAGTITARLAALFLLLLAGGYLIALAGRAVLFWAVPAGAAAIRKMLVWARAHDNVFGREILALLDPARREARTLVVLALLLVLGSWGFFGVLEDIVTGDPLVRADASIFHALQALRTPWGDMFMVAVTELGDAKVTVPVTFAALGWLAWRRAWIDAAYLAAAVVLAQAMAAAIKLALHTPRPIPDLYQGWSAFSFPSGHATVNAVMYGFLGVMLIRAAGPFLRPVIISALTVLVGLIAFSRIYLGAHWFSDVAGGLGFGIAWVSLLGIAYIRHRPAEYGATGLMLSVAAALTIAGVVNIGISYSRDLQRYRPETVSRTMSISEWRSGGWATTPSRRVDLAGELEEPFVLQFAGAPDTLAGILTKAGWRTPPEWDASGVVAWLTGESLVEALPVLPKLHDGRTPALMLEHPEAGGASRLVLRVWDSNVELTADRSRPPLWLATVTREDLRHPLGLVSLALTEADANGPREVVAGALSVLRRSRAEAREAQAGWDGVVLLAPATGFYDSAR